MVLEREIQSKKEIRIALALGGLLHDIGKVTLRALNEEERTTLHQQVGRESSYKDTFKYAHAYHTYLFLDKEKIKHPIIKISAYHHIPEKVEDDKRIYAKIYQLADQFSSVERSKKEKEMELDLLRPVFQMIKLPDTSDSKKDEKDAKMDSYIYKLNPLSISKDILFPEKIDKNKVADINNQVSSEYKKLQDQFLEEFNNCKKFFDQDLETALYHILSFML